MLPKDGVDLVLRAMRTPGSRPGRARNGFHSPILPDPRAERMTGPPDGYDIQAMNRKGILVVTRDTLRERLGYADSAPQPDEVFRQAVKSIEHAKIMSP